MSGFNDRFGGNVLQPTDVSYAAYTLAGNLPTFWPPYADTTNVLARQMDIAPTAAGFKIFMPDATLATAGINTMFRNTGAFSFIVANFSGSTLYTLTPGQVINIYTTDNSTQAGSWGTYIIGAGIASLDLANAAGNGLFVQNSKLAVSMSSSATATNRTVSINDVATAFIWIGGTGTFTLPLSSSVGNQFMFEVRNQGSGALTLATTGGETVDNSSSVILQVNESCFVHAGVGLWFTVGRGRNTQFAFTQLQKTVTAGTVVLTLTEASNVVQTYTGTLTSNVDIVVPAVVQVYYISNQTSGAFNFRVKAPGGGGTTVSIPTGQNAVLFCDGTNVINASTTLAGISSLVLSSGSAASPSLGVGASNSGIFSSGSNLVSVAANGVKVADFSGTGLAINVAGANVTLTSGAGNSFFITQRPAGSVGYTGYYTGANARWLTGVDSAAEAGSNAGSNYFFNAYNDAGAFLSTALSIARANGAVTIPGPVTLGSTITAGAGSFTTAGSLSTLTVTDGTGSGANIKLVGNSGTPAKYIRSVNGNFGIVNNAYTVEVFTVSDVGNVNVAGGIGMAGSLNVGGNIFAAGEIRAGGALVATTDVYVLSDRRLKSQIQSTFWSAPLRLWGVSGVTYVKGGERRYGLIAQDLDKNYPELVDKSQEFWSVNYTGLVGELVNSNKMLWVIVMILLALEFWRATQ